MSGSHLTITALNPEDAARRLLEFKPLDARSSLVRAYEVKTEFLAARIAWHLAHGCDTAQRARELALAEWDAGVLGVRNS